MGLLRKDAASEAVLSCQACGGPMRVASRYVQSLGTWATGRLMPLMNRDPADHQPVQAGSRTGQCTEGGNGGGKRSGRPSRKADASEEAKSSVDDPSRAPASAGCQIGPVAGGQWRSDFSDADDNGHCDAPVTYCRPSRGRVHRRPLHGVGAGHERLRQIPG